MATIYQKNNKCISNRSQTKNAVGRCLWDCNIYCGATCNNSQWFLVVNCCHKNSSISDVAEILNLPLAAKLRIENKLLQKRQKVIFKFRMVIRPLNLHRQNLKLRKIKLEKTTDVLAWASLTSKDAKEIIFSTITVFENAKSLRDYIYIYIYIYIYMYIQGNKSARAKEGSD